MSDPRPWFAGDGDHVRRHAPATLRNREPIAAALAGLLPERGLVLEVASGSGEHCAYFAERFPASEWQPSDPDPQALASIAAWTDGLANVRAPVELDASSDTWPLAAADAVFCANMIHISPWAATLGLMAGASRLLPVGGPLILYGPFLRAGVETAPSNLAFDRNLRERNPEWGIRQLEQVDAAAEAAGLRREQLVDMPANNLMLAYRRGGAANLT